MEKNRWNSIRGSGWQKEPFLMRITLIFDWHAGILNR